MPMCRKVSQKGKPAWLNREFWLELGKQEETLQPLEEAADDSRGLQGCNEIMQGEN